ncbi:MAG: hypothetical protein COA86_10265 [Kangiella sp.]|nr:MAG: hypothetical protein COA86_10265 [Kangiella sp.]
MADWQVDPSSNLLINNGIEKKIEPKVMELLVFLAQNCQQVVSRDSLLDSVWEQVVLDDALTNTIAQLRKALGDNQSPKRFIETIPKKGYRLIPNVEWSTEQQETSIERIDSYSKTSDNRRIGDQELDQSKGKLKQRYWLGLPIIGALMLIILYFQSQPNNSIIPSLPSEQSIAVLPFDVYSDDTEIKYFADGLTEELIHQLAGDPDVRVIARTSSEKFRDSELTAQQIAKILNVSFIVEGSIRQSGEQLRTTVQLIDTEKGFHLWSKTFDNKSDELFLDTQISIGKKVSSLITNKRANPDTYTKRLHPRSAEAYKFFILAQSHMKLAKVVNYSKALEYYQKAIEITPDYALAYTGMAASTLLLMQYKHTSTRQAHKDATEYLDSAFAIEPNLAEAYAVRGLQKTYAQQFESAEQDYLHAIRLNPNLRFAHHNYGYMLSLVNRTKESIQHMQIALEMDPLSNMTNFGIADAMVGIGEVKKGIEQFESCRELLPEKPTCALGLATVYGLLNNTSEFENYLNIAEPLANPHNFWVLMSKAKLLLQQGLIKDSEQLINKILKKNNFSYHALKTKLMIHLTNSKLANFSNHIASLSLEYPNAIEIHFLLGLTHYFENNCEVSVVQYEKGKKEKEYNFFSVWDWTEGISHQLSLAHCYQQTQETTAFKKALNEYRQYVDQLPESQFVIPGKIYNQARYLVLMNQPMKAKQQLDKITDWSFFWLVEKDPILRSLNYNRSN